MQDPELTPEEVRGLQERGEITLVDVREPHEHDAGHIPGDLHIPVARLSEEAGSLEGKVVFYCRSGGRSAFATDAFRAAGLDAANMSGGILAWVERGLPLEPDGGRVAEH